MLAPTAIFTLPRGFCSSSDRSNVISTLWESGRTEDQVEKNSNLKLLDVIAQTEINETIAMSHWTEVTGEDHVARVVFWELRRDRL